MLTFRLSNYGTEVGAPIGESEINFNENEDYLYI